MIWSTERLQDRDGHWVHVLRGLDIIERLGPFDDGDEAFRQEIQARMRIRLAHGSSAFEA
jgi:hypothetical protein